MELDPEKVASLRSLPTSSLLILYTHVGTATGWSWWFGADWNSVDERILASTVSKALVAIGTEIDRRIPVPA